MACPLRISNKKIELNNPKQLNSFYLNCLKDLNEFKQKSKY